jgi:hypothetical protein
MATPLLLQFKMVPRAVKVTLVRLELQQQLKLDQSPLELQDLMLQLPMLEPRKQQN